MRATVVIVHGIVEHGGRYGELAQQLCDRGYAVVAMDLRGHGRSQGDRVWVDRVDRYLDDLDCQLARLRRDLPETPIFLFGQSMGGAIVALDAIRKQPQLRGIVLSAPAVEIGGGVFPWLRRLAGIVDHVLPRLRLVRMGGGHLSRDPQVVADFRSDPLVFHGRIPVRTGAEVIRAARRLNDRLEELRLPLLVLHGTDDAVTDPAGSRRLLARAASPDKTLKLYPGLWHDLVHEPEREQVIADVLDWFDSRSVS